MAQTLQQHVVNGAIKIIEDPNRWCDLYQARTVLGIPCHPSRRYALRFCAEGAIIRSAYQMVADKKQAKTLADNIINEFPFLAVYNDVDGRKAAIAQMREKYPAC